MDQSLIRYYIVNSRTDPRVAIAGFMLRTDAEKFITILLAREGTHGDQYSIVDAQQ